MESSDIEPRNKLLEIDNSVKIKNKHEGQASPNVVLRALWRKKIILLK